MLDDELGFALQQRRQHRRYRQRLIRNSPQQTHVTVDGRPYLSFCSNDYLGLANHPEVIAAMQQAAAVAGVGSGASHLVSGHSEHHHQLELALAEYTGRDRALLFSTGYMANLGVVGALAGRGDTILEDRLNHASLIDAGLLSRAHLQRFRHNDCQQLTGQLSANTKGRRLVVVDGVFSMDGDIAPMMELAELCRQTGSVFMVDDAHGFGVLGREGGGVAEHFRLDQNQLPVLVGTLGKAFGTFGAFVAGSEALIETLIQFARCYIYTTAIPPAVVAATLTSLRLLRSECWRRDSLNQCIRQFRRGAARLGLPVMASITPIQPLLLGDDRAVVEATAALRRQGLLITAIRPPTVPEGTARLRITFSATHTEADIERLLRVLDQVVPLSHRQSPAE